MKNSILVLTIALLAYSCKQDPDLIEPSSGDADVTAFIAIGDSYMSGYQDGALIKDGQRRSIAALLARQFTIISDNPFNNAPMIDNQGLGINSKPWEGLYAMASVMGTRTDCEGEESLGPVKTFHTGGSELPYLASALFTDLNDYAIPFALTEDFLKTNYGAENVYYNRLTGVIAI